MIGVNPLTSKELFHCCDPQQFTFETTDELQDLHEIIGQIRAVEAVRFGIGIDHDGYNIFALGPSGSGKHSLITQFFKNQAASEATPSDWCYVHNFEHDYIPRAISLPAGMGSQFQKDINQLVEEIRNSLTSAFES